jgi:hypothetical protein
MGPLLHPFKKVGFTIKPMPCEHACNGTSDYCSEGSSQSANYLEKRIVQNSIDYQLHRDLGNQTIYWAGHEVAIGQEQQPRGLGGYTDTATFIMLAPDNQIREDFAGHDVDLDQHGVLYHEKRHFDDEDGGHDEYHNRWKEWADKHLWKLKFDPAALDSVDISYEGELPKKADNSSVGYTIY